MARDTYFALPECSNSDLSDLRKLLNPGIYTPDYAEALRFGTLVDAFLTEMHKVNVYENSVDGEVYKKEDFENARLMKAAFYRDKTCANFMKLSDCQKVSIAVVGFEYNGFKFKMSTRCKWDLFLIALRMGADIKTTTAKTQKEFEAACSHFSYYRSRVWYMLIENTDQDMLIGISKVNHKIFKIPIKRGDANWNIGYAQACELAFYYWFFFDGFNTNINQLTIL